MLRVKPAFVFLQKYGAKIYIIRLNKYFCMERFWEEMEEDKRNILSDQPIKLERVFERLALNFDKENIVDELILLHIVKRNFSR